MARAARLNVYVTPAGFYDAVVAAADQKAALARWEARDHQLESVVDRERRAFVSSGGTP